MNEKDKWYKKVLCFIAGFLLFPILWLFRRLFQNKTKPDRRMEQLNADARKSADTAGTAVAGSIDAVTKTEDTIKQSTDRARELLEEIKGQPIKE